MRTLLRFLVLASVGMVLLVHLAGGWRGPIADRPDPKVETALALPEAERGFVPPVGPPVSLHAGRGIGIEAAPEPFRFEDPATGTQVLVPELVRWSVRIDEAIPVDPAEPHLQGAAVRGVELLTYREPQTLEEARALAEGREGARAPLVRWRVRAPEARGLMSQLDLASRGSRALDPNLVVQLSGGVELEDVVEGVRVEGDALELEPYRGVARGDGRYHVEHASFHIDGEGLDLARTETSERFHLLRNAEVALLGSLSSSSGSLSLDVPADRFRPGSMRAAGGATVVRETGEDGFDHLTIDLQEDVHVSEEGGRTLDAERIHVTARRPTRIRGAASAPWRLRRFEAEDGVSIEFPGMTKQGRAWLISVAAQRMLLDRLDDGDVTTFEGQPVLVLRGGMPLGAVVGDVEPGLMRVQCEEQAVLRPARPGDAPPGQDLATLRRLELRGRSSIERRDLGLDAPHDTLAADRMSVLFRAEARAPGAGDETGLGDERLVPLAFACEGDVVLGGSRLAGTTDRLVGEGLDGPLPVVTAEGRETSFAFHDLQRDQRLLAEDRSSAGPGRGAGPSDEGPAFRWALDHLVARHDVDVLTSFGGAALGIPAHLEAETVGYDRLSDQARLQAPDGGVARVTVGADPEARQWLAARTLTVRQLVGEVHAQGQVEGSFLVAEGTGGGIGDASGLLLPEGHPGVATRLQVTTQGRVEIRPELETGSQRIRPEVRQRVRIDGPLVAEVLTGEQAVDRLRAGFLELALVRTTVEAPDLPSVPTARVRTPARPPSTARPPRAPAAAHVRWTLTAGDLRATLAGEGLGRLEAAGTVLLRSVEGEIRGDRLVFDQARRLVRIDGRPGERARAGFGPAIARNEFEADALLAAWSDEGLTRVQGSAPARALLLRRDPERPGRLERYEVLCRGDVVVTTDRLTTELPVEIRRHERVADDAPWVAPSTLWADRLEVQGRDLLSQAAPDVQRLIASGPSTTFRSGEGAELITVWADRFELEPTTHRAVLVGTPQKDVYIRRGPPEAPTLDAEQARLVIDVETGLIEKASGSRIIWRRVR